MRKFLFVFVALMTLCGYASAAELRDLLTQSMKYYESGDCADALPIFEKILAADLKEVKGNRTLYYTLNYYAGYCARNTGEPDKTMRYLETAKKYYIDSSQLPVINTFLGDAAREKFNYTVAENYYNLALKGVAPDGKEAATIWLYMAETHRGMKNYEASLKDCERSLDISTALKEVRTEVLCMAHIGEVYNERREYPEAIRMFSNALALSRNAQLPFETAANNVGLALVYEALNMSDFARQNYHDALRLYVFMDVTENIPLIARHLIDLPAVNKQTSLKAADYYTQLADMLARSGDYDAIFWMEIAAATYFAGGGETDKAVAIYRGVVARSLADGYSEQAVTASVRMADVLSGTGKYADAMGALIELEQQLDKKDSEDLMHIVYGAQGAVCEKLGRDNLALEYYARAEKAALTDEDRTKYRSLQEAVNARSNTGKVAQENVAHVN